MLKFNTLFYGWKLASIVGLGNFLLQGSTIYVINAFVDPFTEAYGWSRGDLGIATGIGAFWGSLSMSSLSSLSLHLSLRWIMTLGAILGGAGFIVMGQTDKLWLFTIAFTAIWVGGQACGGVVGNFLMSNWFIKYRGRAFGVINMGTSASGAILPLLVLFFIHKWGISTATLILGLSSLLILAPLSFFWVQDTPEAMGLTPDALTPYSAEKEQNPAPLSWASLVHSWPAYKTGLAFGLGLLVAAGITSQLQPRFTDLGLSAYAGMLLLCVVALFSSVSKYLWGYLTDRLGATQTARLLFLSNALAICVAFLPQNGLTIALFVLCIGLTVGGFWTSMPAVVVQVFGRNQFLAAYRFIAIFTLMRGLGNIITGLSSELTGSYNPAYFIYILMLLLGFALLWQLEPKP